MREILFRGKREDNGEWVWGYLNQHRGDQISDCCGNAVNGYDYYINDYTAKIDTGLYGVIYKIVPETAGQYTGLTDKNGIGIFEGDIIIFNRGRNLPNTKPRPLLVFWDERSSRFTTNAGSYAFLQKDMMVECEVIGNIYDNPELLKGD